MLTLWHSDAPTPSVNGAPWSDGEYLAIENSIYGKKSKHELRQQHTNQHILAQDTYYYRGIAGRQQISRAAFGLHAAPGKPLKQAAR